MLIKITNVVDKNKDWKIISYETPEGGVTENASVNRVDKKGIPFPDFDGIMVGRQIDANPWRNPTTGKWIVFPPKPASNGNFTRSSPTGGAKVELEKVRNENITKNMKWKAEGQAYGNSVTNAVNIVIALIENKGVMDSQEIKGKIIEYRDFLLDEAQSYQEQSEKIRSGEIPF